MSEPNPTTEGLSDGAIRPALRQALSALHSQEADTILIDELGLCQGKVRVDIAVVNGVLHGYEIKSDRDNLRRLEGQVNAYSRALEFATLVVVPRHLDAVLAMLPEWWGIWIADIQASDGGVSLTSLRPAQRNPAQDPRSTVELLWSDAARKLLAGRATMRGINRVPRRLIWDRLCELLELDEITAAVRSHLKQLRTCHGIELVHDSG